MQDSALLARMFRSLRSCLLVQERGAPDNRTVTLDGVVAAISPATPGRSVLNSVVYERPGALEAAIDELAALYEDAGVCAWTVWVHQSDTRAARLLERAGHRLDASPRAMGLALDALPPATPDLPELSREWGLLPIAWSINDRAYGDAEGTWARALGELLEDCGQLYVADLEGKPASFVLMHDHEDDCDFWFAATLPEARGRGLVTALLQRALTDARERGLNTSTTQATAMGAPVYRRLGYRDLGALQMWERRRS